MATLHEHLALSLSRIRIKKPFNAILGETFEFVESNYRAVAEQVSHHPPISALKIEGNGYTIETFDQVDQSFGLSGGNLKITVKQNGLARYILPKYGDEILISKPVLIINNLVFGTKYLDTQGVTRAINMTNKMSLELEYHPKSWSDESHITGKVVDSNGKELMTVEGEWLKQIRMKNVRTGLSEVVWRRDAVTFLVESNRQYDFNEYTIKLNHLPPKSDIF